MMIVCENHLETNAIVSSTRAPWHAWQICLLLFFSSPKKKNGYQTATINTRKRVLNAVGSTNVLHKSGPYERTCIEEPGNPPVADLCRGRRPSTCIDTLIIIIITINLFVCFPFFWQITRWVAAAALAAVRKWNGVQRIRQHHPLPFQQTCQALSTSQRHLVLCRTA